MPICPARRMVTLSTTLLLLDMLRPMVAVSSMTALRKVPPLLLSRTAPPISYGLA